MTIDTFITTALADEFNEHLAGGRIQDAVEIDRETFGLEIYANRQRHYLLLSADNQQPRALLAPNKLRRGVQKASPMGLLFRHRVEGMRLQAIRQPPWERVLIFDLISEDAELHLIIEMIERRANLLLVEEDMILECARRVSGDDNRYRVILPRHKYIPPPPFENQLDPRDITPKSLNELFLRVGDKQAWKALVQIKGFNPRLARETIYRAYQVTDIKASDCDAYHIQAALDSFLSNLVNRQWDAGIVFDDNGIPKTASVVELTHLGDWQPTATISEALNGFYGELEGTAVYDAARIPIRTQLQDARERIHYKLQNLERELVDDGEIEFLRKAGELILAYQYTIQPEQKELVEQYDPEGEPLTIKLKTDLTPLENAQRYFERYEKKKRARDQLPKEIRATKHEVDYLDQLNEDLTMAENWQDIGEVQDALQKNGYWKGKKYAQPKGGKSAPMRIVTDEGFVILVGRNSRQNEQLLQRSDPTDLWLHAREVPGSHVIIKTNGRNVPPHILEQAASYAAYYSKLRNDASVLVQVADRRHIRKIKGGRPGQVTIQKEHDGITVKPQAFEP